MSLLKPDLILGHVTDITPELLQRHRLRGLIVDLDNTLIPYGSFAEALEVQTWTGELLERGIKMYMVSNALPERVAFWTQRLNFPGVGLASKPLPRAFKKAVKRMGLQSRQVAMVGDQLFTDVLGGNLIGAFTIMVRPLSDNALPHTKFTRRMEQLVLRRFSSSFTGD
ncbi:hypothetical protein HNR42_002353 [Deinobacterium chartae]|uniref:YqeG family HAD IIIA-type phosphatase n=1 Tax=Deinobacterium chartae TaxID=521158 RepID=A0A841I3H0_9DEIO|nr:YqeG family HAD IIIA-type phosphatase [Deinobacterium chartae]MBB6098918.1 hypothetical protein [Deinobacterium chartae]